jgi:predicted dehydrogenase
MRTMARTARLALIGAGSRGRDAYGSILRSGALPAAFVAVAEPDPGRRAAFAREQRIDAGSVFADWREMLARPGLADAVIIASPDSAHYEQAVAALSSGLHVLLEKPMSSDPRECVALGDLASAGDRVFSICHVLRYAPFFAELKSLLDTGAIGKLRCVQHNENIGYWHFAHSFVRGNWRSSRSSSPLILSKSCHDMDILLWLVGSDCARIASYGSLSHFKGENAPPGAGERCFVDCRVEAACPYSANKLYYKSIGGWPAKVLTEDQTEAGIDHALAEGPYGLCVYRRDNDVVDQQVSILEFENGVSAAFTLSAFTRSISRTIKLMGGDGEIRGDLEKNHIEVHRFGSPEPRILRVEESEGGHSGGDRALLGDFVSAVVGRLKGGRRGTMRTEASISVQSHVMAFAAEAARLEHRSIEIPEFWRRLRE